jgi:hypothetical protein
MELVLEMACIPSPVSGESAARTFWAVRDAIRATSDKPPMGVP